MQGPHEVILLSAHLLMVDSNNGKGIRLNPLNASLIHIQRLGNQRPLEVSDLWSVDDRMSAASLSTALDAALERQQKDETRFNDRLSHGQVQPGLWRVLKQHANPFRTQSTLLRSDLRRLGQP